MEQLTKGRFYGNTNEWLECDDLLITNTLYTHDYVDWHYHETPYFTFILEGCVIEGTRTTTHTCPTGTILFHNWDDAHYNRKPKGRTRGFHIELDKKWIDRFEPALEKLSGNINIIDPAVKLSFYQVFIETRCRHTETALGIESGLLALLNNMTETASPVYAGKPAWVERIIQILHDQTEYPSLNELALLVDLHPVHLSAQFSRYFNCTLGAYIRKLKIDRSIPLLARKELSLAGISMDAGFADQSHFIRAFKREAGVTPLVFRKMLTG